ncbi:MAG: cadmium resistance transporter [Gemmatimonadota bacterium]|nr:MAG: cadmium resistance transporter [Gemmatimonadota bacterium]
MADLLTIVAITGATFATTNLDNLGLLLALFADEGFGSRDILLGYTLAALLVAGVAYSASTAVELAPARYLGYLGLVPIAVGLLRAYELLRSRASTEDVGRRLGRGGALTVALLNLAQSGDTFAVYVTVFADTRERLEIPILATVAACVFASCALARWLATHSTLALPLQRWGRYLLPLLLIAIGLYIIADSATDVAGALPQTP